jgi:hypothetical protein
LHIWLSSQFLGQIKVDFLDLLLNKYLVSQIVDVGKNLRNLGIFLVLLDPNL